MTNNFSFVLKLYFPKYKIFSFYFFPVFFLDGAIDQQVHVKCYNVKERNCIRLPIQTDRGM